MDNAIHVSRKLQQIRELVSEIEALMEDSKVKPDRSPFYGVDSIIFSREYDLSDDGARWITCAEICSEVGIDPTRANCTSVGRYLAHKGLRTRRSNGRTLVHMPNMRDEF